MDSTENNQEVVQAFERTEAGSTEEAANNILNMWESSDDQPTNEETEDTTENEEVVEEEETEAEEVEEQEDEVETEEVSEEEEATEELEETEEPEVYTIKVDGEELEVDIDELKSGYQRQSDYTRKSQALAEARKQNEAIQSERIKLEQERQMYANGLQMLREQQAAKLKEFNNVDWETLKEDDPYQYMIKKDEYRDAQEKANNATQQQKIVQQQQAQAQAQVRATRKRGATRSKDHDEKS